MLVKFCNQKYLPKNSGKIQIGTLDYYRKLDKKFIADPLEGIIEELLEPQISTELTNGDREKVFGDSLKMEGNYHFVMAPGSKASQVKVIPNMYVFSCSFVEEGHRINPSILNYDSYYRINDADSFAKYISRILKDHVTVPSETTDIFWAWNKVEYVDKKTVTRLSTEKFGDSLSFDMLFTKTKESSLDASVKFEDNNELRFVWLFLDVNKNVLPAPSAPLQLPIEHNLFNYGS